MGLIYQVTEPNRSTLSPTSDKLLKIRHLKLTNAAHKLPPHGTDLALCDVLWYALATSVRVEASRLIRDWSRLGGHEGGVGGRLRTILPTLSTADPRDASSRLILLAVANPQTNEESATWSKEMDARRVSLDLFVEIHSVSDYLTFWPFTNPWTRSPRPATGGSVSFNRG